ncbi:hypothetical protein [Photorhabdus noenieputensis]|uniref:hypothetical protein n=1 Tax=Photorhabdus noenieputensis TaxID=1208607 RepID=UPI001BD4EDD5|nr:hypothetical protein [Photorhabdus noenieputensis]MCK3667559.1 hypothetical protein [Photorhabdus noenieputensis]
MRTVVRLVNVRVFPRRPLIHAVSKKPGKKNRNASTASVFVPFPPLAGESWCWLIFPVPLSGKYSCYMW